MITFNFKIRYIFRVHGKKKKQINFILMLKDFIECFHFQVTKRRRNCESQAAVEDNRGTRVI